MKKFRRFLMTGTDSALRNFVTVFNACFKFGEVSHGPGNLLFSA